MLYEPACSQNDDVLTPRVECFVMFNVPFFHLRCLSTVSSVAEPDFDIIVRDLYTCDS
jgi:hypothetical protein